MAGVSARELRPIVENGRAAERAVDQTSDSMPDFLRALADPELQRRLGTVAGVLHAFDQSDLAKQAGAISAFGGPSIDKLAEFAGPVSSCDIGAAGVLSGIAEANREIGAFAAIYEPYWKAIGADFSATETAIRHLAALSGPSVAEMESWQKALNRPVTEALESLAALKAGQETVALAVQALRPTVSQIAADQSLGRRVESLARPSPEMSSVAKWLDRQERESRIRFSEIAAQFDAMSSPYSALQLGAASKAVMWPLEFPRGWPRTVQERDALPIYPESEGENDEQFTETGLYIPAAGDIILPGGETFRRRGGRPPGPDLTRDQFLGRLAEGLARLPAYQRQDAKVKTVVRLAGLKVATVYHYFKLPAFGWPGGKVGWHLVLALLLERATTQRDWDDLFNEMS